MFNAPHLTPGLPAARHPPQSRAGEGPAQSARGMAGPATGNGECACTCVKQAVASPWTTFGGMSWTPGALAFQRPQHPSPKLASLFRQFQKQLLCKGDAVLSLKEYSLNGRTWGARLELGVGPGMSSPLDDRTCTCPRSVYLSKLPELRAGGEGS